MTEGLKKKYGLFTAIAMVVGIVIGSGVFFKAEKVLTATGGNLPLGILSWIIGGLIMVVCAYSFAVLATRYEKVNGIVDYAEAALGEKYGYMVGWFMAVIYAPTLTGVLAWVSARYTCVLFGWDITGGNALAITMFYLVGSYALNALSPILAGKFQVTTTVIKLIPLYLMAIVGTVAGLRSGMTMENFSTVVQEVNTGTALFTAVCATAFAYEGWIIATSINAELKDAKKNLPRALVMGTLVVMATYILYYVGLAGTVSNETMMAGGETGARLAFEMILGRAGGTLVFVLIVVSCLGTLNGLTVGSSRALYSVSSRGYGPCHKIFGEVDKETNMPANSAVFGLVACSAWLVYFFGANLTSNWFGVFGFDSTELPIITVYAFYIPIFIKFMIKEKDLSVGKRFILPGLALLGSVFMVLAAIYAHGVVPYLAAKEEGRFSFTVLFYLIIFAVIMVIGALFMKKKEVVED